MTQPNIIIFFSDDHGQWALPCYGNTELRTPNLDRLAARGTVFENAFTPIPVCSPARASFFTGLMPSRHGVHDFISARPEFHRRNWLDGLDSLPLMLQRAGYQCGFSGKWHLGNDDTPQPGFDYWYSMSGAYPVRHDGAQEISDNGEVAEKPGYLTDNITDGAIRFLKERDRDRPFFLFVAYYATHSPWEGHPDRFVEPYRNASFRDIPEASRIFGDYDILNLEAPAMTPEAIQEARAQYYGAVTHIDSGLGRVLDEVRREGEEALCVYTSDHGLCLGHHAIWGKGNGTRPANMIEESIRIPMVVARTDGAAPHQHRTELVDHTDLHRTVAAIAAAGAEHSDGQARPGHDFSGLLAGGTSWPKRVQFGEYGPLRMARDDRFKAIVRTDGPAELYDLSAPDAESRNLAGTPEGEPQLRRLANEIHAFFAAPGSGGDKRWKDAESFQFNTMESWKL